MHFKEVDYFWGLEQYIGVMIVDEEAIRHCHIMVEKGRRHEERIVLYI